MRGLALFALMLVAPVTARAEGAPKPTPDAVKPDAKSEPKPEAPPAPPKVEAKSAPFDPSAPLGTGSAQGERKDAKAAFDELRPNGRGVSEPTLELQKDDEELSLGWVLLRTMVVLGIVVALAYLTLNVGMRKLLGIRTTGGARGLVEVLERVPLDQKRVLFVIRAGEELLLVGGSDVSLSLITKLDSASVDKLKAEHPAQPLQLSPFLQKLLGRKDAPPPPAA